MNNETLSSETLTLKLRVLMTMNVKSGSVYREIINQINKLKDLEIDEKTVIKNCGKLTFDFENILEKRNSIHQIMRRQGGFYNKNLMRDLLNKIRKQALRGYFDTCLKFTYIVVKFNEYEIKAIESEDYNPRIYPFNCGEFKKINGELYGLRYSNVGFRNVTTAKKFMNLYNLTKLWLMNYTNNDVAKIILNYV